MPDSTPCRRSECRDAKKYLRTLISATEAAINLIDAEMKKPSTAERGSRVAEILNSLELSKDIAKRYGLTAKKRTTTKGSHVKT